MRYDTDQAIKAASLPEEKHMAKTTRQRHVIISPAELARWLEAQPGTWWFVDGDPGLGSEVDFPCPNDELADVLKHQNGDLFVLNVVNALADDSTIIQKDDLERFAQRENRHGNREFVMQWSDLGDPWVLSEDKEASSED